jgi:hypothetical protein
MVENEDITRGFPLQSKAPATALLATPWELHLRGTPEGFACPLLDLTKNLHVASFHSFKKL